MFFRKFKPVNRSEHGRGADEFNYVLEDEDGNCSIPSGKTCFLKCISYNFKKDLSMEHFVFMQSYKRRTIVMTRCRIPVFCERYKIDIEIYVVITEMEHSVVKKSNFGDLGHIWEPYLKLDVLCLALIYATHSMAMQNESGFGVKDCIEDSLGRKYFGKY